MRQNKVVLGLSGGVDSAVAARLLQEQGWEVHPLWLDAGTGAGRSDAQAVAQLLNLPFAEASIAPELERYVCAPFQADYLAGRTPLPCARCNPTVKFPALLRYADQIGADFVATGHYARVRDGLLHKGQPSNDQSYLLSRLTREQLQRVIFPLGDYEKAQVRQLAETFSLPVAHKKDSMEICFIPDGDYAAWLDRRGQTPPAGHFVDGTGKVLGTHKGIHHYTLGQRRGLGISAAARLFVSAIRPETNEVVLSFGDDLCSSTVFCTEPNWLSISALTAPLSVTVRLRHSKAELPSILYPEGAQVRVELDIPGRAPTPGQLAVFYDGDLVVGSAWIAGTGPSTSGSMNGQRESH